MQSPCMSGVLESSHGLGRGEGKSQEGPGSVKAEIKGLLSLQGTALRTFEGQATYGDFAGSKKAAGA